MKLLKLKLNNYRNCENIELNFSKNKTLIIGKNAQGKTNILESIYFLSTLKTPRTSNNTELIKIGTDLFTIEGNIEKSQTNIEMFFSYTKDKKRELKLNGLKSNLKEFKSTLKTVLFSITDLLLLRGAPQDRRDWLDRAISQIYPVYDERLAKYDKIRIQKNNLLKESAKTGIYNETLLDVYNEQLSITGSNIIFLRKKYLKEIEKIAKLKHKSISETEDLSVTYDCSFINEEDYETEIIQQKFKNALSERKTEELRRCQACVGPHRDDLQFMINNFDALKFASQGQQRSIVLALKLAELEIITQKTDQIPLLLLDDVLAELDDLRQNYLLKSINPNTQTIITSVDTLLFENEFLKDVEIYTIENGKILE